MKGYREILKQREFCKILAAGIVGRAGDAVDAVAFTWLTYALTGSAGWASVMFGLNQLPNVLLQPFAGAIVESMNKKRVLIVTDLVRCALVTLTAIVYLSGRMSPWYLAAFTLCMTTAEVFHLPAGTALVPKTLPQEHYAFGLSMETTLLRAAALAGTGAAGVVVGAFGVAAAFAVDGVTFLLSAALLTLVRPREEAPPQETNAMQRQTMRQRVRGYNALLKEGFAYFKNSRVLVNFCALAVLLNAALVPMNALQTPLAVEIYGMGPELLSVLGVAVSLGAIAGSLLTPYLMKRFSARRIVVASGVLAGLCYMGLLGGGGFRERAIVAYALGATFAGLLCLFVSFIAGVLNVQFMKSVKETYLARSAAIFNAFSSASMPALSFLIGAIAGMVSARTIFLIAAASCVALFLLIGVGRVDYGEEMA